MSSNTLESDINEIMCAYFLADKNWRKVVNGEDAKRQYMQRLKQVKPEAVTIQTHRAKIMVEAFLKWAVQNRYSRQVKETWWTARPGIMTKAVGEPVDQKKNPTDVLVKFTRGPSEGFLGLSAKSTHKMKGDIGFKNPGLGTMDTFFKLKMNDEVGKAIKKVMVAYDLPSTNDARKAYIRSHLELKEPMDNAAEELLGRLRDELFNAMKKTNPVILKKHFREYWLNAQVMHPPYVKVTGGGDGPAYRANIMDPIKNPKLYALARYDLVLTKIQNTTIGVAAGTHRIMKIRLKFDSEKMASSVKLVGDPW